MINVRMPEEDTQLKPRITVIGVGGGGSNAVNNMIQSNLEGVEFLVCNTDAQALQNSLAERKIQLGTNITRGLGAGARPDVGRAAAEEALDDVMGYLEGSNMAFITAGMGGGSGSGGAPVIARAAREAGILTVGVVTKPFHFEGQHRMKIADAAIEELQQYVDTLLIIPNQNLFRVANEKTTFADAFKMADDVLHCGVRGVTDLMVMPGLINLDFADIRTVMAEMGKAMMGTGEAEGDRRAVEAAEAAISNPLLEDATMQCARGVLVNITGGYDMTLFEVDEACNRIRDEVDPDANIIFGSTFNESLEGIIRVSVVSTGIESEAARKGKSQGMQAQQDERPSSYRTQVAQPQQQEQKRTTFGGLRMGGGNPPASNTGNNNPTSSVARSGLDKITASHTQEAVSASAISREMTQTVGNTMRKVEQQEEIGYVEEQAEPEFDMTPQQESMADNASGEEGFIPPSPVTVSKEDKEQPQPDPFAEADMINTGTRKQPAASREDEPAPRKSTSLFERLTGSSKNERRDEGEKQSALSVSREEHVATSSDSEDDLDIPAFLRRQVS